jgi:hypothetical protein
MVGISTMADIDMMDMPDYAAQMESFQRSDAARQNLIEVSRQPSSTCSRRCC